MMSMVASLVKDNKTSQACLLDSGTQVSLWPTQLCGSFNMSPTSASKLVAAKGPPIPAFWQGRHEINFADRFYKHTFIYMKICRPIVGIDILQIFRMKIDCESNSLRHSGPFVKTSLHFKTVNQIHTVHQKILSSFPEITVTHERPSMQSTELSAMSTPMLHRSKSCVGLL